MELCVAVLPPDNVGEAAGCRTLPPGELAPWPDRLQPNARDDRCCISCITPSFRTGPIKGKAFEPLLPMKQGSDKPLPVLINRLFREDRRPTRATKGNGALGAERKSSLLSYMERKRDES